MELKVQALLAVTQTAVRAIDPYEGGLEFAGYAANSLVRDAVERKLLILGAALSQIARRDPVVAERPGDFRQIIGFRNILVHAYRPVRNRVRWEIVREDLPELARRAQGLLDSSKKSAKGES